MIFIKYIQPNCQNAQLHLENAFGKATLGPRQQVVRKQCEELVTIEVPVRLARSGSAAAPLQCTLPDFRRQFHGSQALGI